MNTSVPSLVTIENNVPLADSREIAQSLGIEPQNFFEMIKDYQQEIEEDFGLIRFQTDAVKIPGQRGTKYIKYALLTEDQAYAYLAYSKNTKQARDCKRKLVKAFSEVRTRLVQHAPQPAPLYLDTALITELEEEGLTPRCIRMVNLTMMFTDLLEATDFQSTHLGEYLIDQFVAEVQAMTPEDAQWGQQTPLKIKPSQKRLKP